MNKTLNEKIRILSLSYFLFLVLLMLSGGIGGVWSRVIYYLAFVITAAMTVLLSGKGILPEKKQRRFSYEKLRLTLPTVLPSVALVALLSLLTSFLIRLISGRYQTVDMGDSILTAIISHAILPSVLEEILFRYLPLRLLAPQSKRAAVLISAAAFALVHHSLYSIPYAFMAGLIFMTLDIALDSIYPSLIIHFLNNLLSIIMIFGMPLPLLIALICLLALSVGALIRNRKSYAEAICTAFTKGESYTLGTEFVLFASLSLIIAVFTL